MRSRTVQICVVLLLVAGRQVLGTEKEFQERAVAQAQEIVGVRESLFAYIKANEPTVGIEKGPSTLTFVISPKTLFISDESTLSPSGEVLMGVFRDAANTYRSLYVDIVYETGPDSGKVLALNTRRGMKLGATVFRSWGLSPAQLTLHLKPSARSLFRLVYHTRKPVFNSAEQVVPFVMVHIPDPLLNFGVRPILPIDVSLVTPAGVRKWSLRLIQTKTGTAVRQFKGTSDVWVPLLWDGRDQNGKPVPAGEYQAFLVAQVYGEGRITDSAGFVVKDPPVRLAAAESRRPIPPFSPPKTKNPASVLPRGPTPADPPPERETRRWAFAVHFSPNQSDISGTAVLEVRQLAATINTFSGEKVIVEGFADSAEMSPRSLAAQRARSVRDALVEGYAVAKERISVRDQEPRKALEGETLGKAVTFFVAEDTE